MAGKIETGIYLFNPKVLVAFLMWEMVSKRSKNKNLIMRVHSQLRSNICDNYKIF